MKKKKIDRENILVIALDVFGSPIYLYVGEGSLHGCILYELYEETIVISDSFTSFIEELTEYID